GVEDGRSRCCRRGKQIEAMRRGSQRLIRDLDTAHQAARIAGMADMNGLRLLSEGGEIAASIDKPARQAEAAQHLQRAIDRETLGNAAEIDPDVTVSKADHLVFEQFDAVE